MAKLKLTQTELKQQKDSLRTFSRYLPTLRIKQQLLQKEWLRAKQHVEEGNQEVKAFWVKLEPWMGCFAESIEIQKWIQVTGINTTEETVAGVPLEKLVDIEVFILPYDLHTTPLWVDQGVVALVDLFRLEVQLRLAISGEKLLAEELLRTSQRINLFEKVKIPEAQNNIKRITVYLDDQAASAVGWARGAKKKRLERELSEVLG